jgi:RNA recognition motif-containing protein
MGRKLYVGNLPFQVGEAELHDLFGRVGAVESINIVTDQMTGRPRGFAFVEMASDAEAQTAIQELHDTELGGRRLMVNEARPKPMGGGGRAGGGGGRGGGFGGGRGPRRGEPRW